MAFCTYCGKDTLPGDLRSETTTGVGRLYCSDQCVKNQLDEERGVQEEIRTAEREVQAELEAEAEPQLVEELAKVEEKPPLYVSDKDLSSPDKDSKSVAKRKTAQAPAKRKPGRPRKTA